MRLADDVPAFFELVHKLGPCLLGHAHVVGDVGDRRVTLTDSRDPQPVRRADISESPARKPFRYGLDELRCEQQGIGRHGPVLSVGHVPILTDRRQPDCLMPLITSSDAVVFEAHGARFSSYVRPARGSDQLCAWRIEVPAGQKGAPHRPSREEVICCIDGELTITLDGTAHSLRPGDAAYVRPAAKSASTAARTVVPRGQPLSPTCRRR